MATEMQTTDQRQVLLPLRAYYFFSFGALGILFPFLPLILSARGLSDQEISWVMVLIPLSNLVIPPLWGLLADTLNARLPLLRVASVGAAVTALAFALPELGLVGHAAAILAFSFFRAPLISLGDAATYDALGGERVDFSKVRVWGSLGFALFVLVPGLVAGPRQILWIVTITAAAYLLAGISTSRLKTTPLHREKALAAQALRAVRRPQVLLFLLGGAVYYSGHAVFDAYFSLHLRQIGLSDGFIGLAWALGVAAEIALMLLAPRFIHRVSSSSLLVSCAGAAAMRWAVLSSTTSPALLLVNQTLHAATFGLWYLSLVKFTQERAAPHLRTSLQSITSSAMGLGMVVGYLAGGQVMHHWDGFALYRIAAIAATVALALYAASHLSRRLEPTNPGRS